MRLLFRFYQYINILSLDVTAGAVIGALFFARILQAPVSPLALLALALSVWIVYTIDHLRDAMLITRIATTDRHRFHQKYFHLLVMALLVVIVADLAVVWFIPHRILIAGIALSVPVGVYLVLQRYLKFLKEFFVACLYTAGILLPSLAEGAWMWLPEQFILVAKYFITAWMNLLLFSLIDYDDDRRHQQHSFVTRFGPTSTHCTIVSLGLLNMLGGTWLWTVLPDAAAVLIAMNAMLLAILFLQKYLARNNYYRITGDGVFFIPLFYLL